MGSQPDNVTTTQNSSPYSGQAPYLNDVFAQARSLFEGPGPQFYPGQSVAQLTPEQQQALSATAMRATQGSPLTSAAQAGLQDLISQGVPGNQAIQGLMGIGQGGLNTGAANGAIQGLSNAGMGPGFGTYQTLANSGLGPSGAGYSGLANGAGATGAANQAIQGL